MLVEAERIGWGTSSRNGGFCHPGFKQSFTTLRRLHGPERAATLYRETIDAFGHVERLCTTSIDADFDRSGHLVLASAPSHAAGFPAAVEAMRDVDMPAYVVPREDLRSEIGSDAYAGGLVVERSAGLHPGKLVAGLASQAEAAGAALHEETAALAMRRQADGRTVVETSRGALIAREVIVGTNGYTGGLTPSLRRRIMAISSFIIVTDPLRPSRHRDQPARPDVLRHQELPLLLAAHAGQPNAVRRTGQHVADVGRPGGGDPATRDGRVHPQLWQTPIAFAWGGRVAFTFDRMVHAGRADGVAYAVGCCGSGVAVMPWLGMRVAEWVGGGDPPEIASLSFPLVPAPYEGRAWFLPLAGEYWKAKDRLAAREASKAG